MPFRFRLEALLSMRERQQEMAESQLSRVLGRLRDCREAMDILENRLSKARNQLASGIERGITASEYSAHSNNISALEARLEEFRKEETRLRMEANRARHNLKVAHRERELVDKLKARKYEEWLSEEQQREQNEADDLSTIRYIRQHQ